MKAYFKTLLLFSLLLVCASLIGTSCNRDKCKTVVCANNSTCNDGLCTCPAGYEGTNCESMTRDNFKGNWWVFEKGNSSLGAQYQINIHDGLVPQDVLIDNFNNYFTYSEYYITIDHKYFVEF